MREKPLVLLVDDEEIFLEIVSVKLQASGFDTDSARSAREAVEKAERLLPELVLSDIYMPPGASGWELAFELRENPKTRDIKIAFFTSLRDPWTVAPSDQLDKITSELSNVAIFNKAEDVGFLPAKLSALIKDTQSVT